MRRGIVLGVLIAVGGLGLAAAGSQGQPQGPKVVRMQSMGVRDNLYLLSGGGGNTAMLITDDGVVLNVEFPTAIDIVAQENTKANMERMDAFKGANAKFLPTKTYQTKMSLLDGVDRIDLYYFGAGHTNGDTIVVFPALRLAHVGDLFASKAAPFIDTTNGGSGVALPQTLARAVAEIKNVDRIITGHTTPPQGAVASRWTTWDDLGEYADFNRDFLAAVQEALKAGKSAEEAAASLKLPEKYKDYGMERAKANIQTIYNELKR